MRLGLGCPRTALIVAPHSDDETIGAYGLMVRLLRRGSRICVMVVSDGAASHPASARWPRSRLVAERIRESRRALRRLGIGAGAVTLLGLPDGRLSPDAADQVRALGRAVRRVRHLDLLVGPTADDAHPDHRAVSAMLARVPAPGARRLHYRVWPCGDHRSRPSAAMLPLGSLRAPKRRTILGYRTQAGLIGDDPHGFAMSRGEVARFAGPAELFQEERR